MTRTRILTVALVLAVVAPGTVAAQGAADTKTVLGLFWSSEDFPSNIVINDAMRQAFRAAPGHRLDYFSEYLESDRFPGEPAELAFRDYLRAKFAGRRIDVVVAIADVARKFALRHREVLFPDAQIVFSALAPSMAAAQPGITGIVSGSGWGHTLEVALGLHPSVRRVLVVAQAPDVRLRRLAEKELQPFEKKVALTYVSDVPLEAVTRAVSAMPADGLVLFIRYSQESPGRVLYPSDVARMVVQASPVPVYGISESYIGTGVVGGVVFSGRRLGQRLADTAIRIAGGTRAETIPTAEAELATMFDWRQLRRWSIDESQLPEGSLVRFKQQSLWEHYGWYVASAIAVIGLQGLLIAALFVLRARSRDTQARNSAMLRALPDIMFLQTREGVFLDCHAQDPSQLFAPPENFIGRNFRDILPPELISRLEPALQRAMDSQSPSIVEYPLRVYGTERHYEARIVPCNHEHLLSIVRDVTERRHAEAALHESQERYALATAAGGVGVWDWNLETNEIYVDPALKALLGFGDEEIPNHIEDWGARVHPDDAPTVMARAQEHIDGATALYEVEHRMVHKDGSIRWFLARGSIVERKDGRAVRVIGTDTDITTRKEAEHALHQALIDLDRVSRLTSLGEFAASVAHEVSQPLTAILVNVKVCLRWLDADDPDLPEVRVALRQVVDSAKRADEMIRRNRELFRHHTVEKTRLDLNSVIREVATLAGLRLRTSHVTLLTDLEPSLPRVLGDSLELQQVLLNLIINAIDAMEGIAPVARQMVIESRLASDAEVEVEVRDSGVGLDGVDLDRMFTPSYTTKPNGTGVGLSISRTIIKAHGGRIWATPNAERGTTVCFTLPVEPVNEPQDAGSSGNPGSPDLWAGTR